MYLLQHSYIGPCPVSLDLKLEIVRGDHAWRLNTSLSNDPEFCAFLSKQISIFISTNGKGDLNDSILWESMKAVLRGRIMSYEAAERKRSKIRLSEREEELTSFETTYIKTTTVLNKIISLKYEYNTIKSKTVEMLFT